MKSREEQKKRERKREERKKKKEDDLKQKAVERAKREKEWALKKA